MLDAIESIDKGLKTEILEMKKDSEKKRKELQDTHEALKAEIQRESQRESDKHDGKYPAILQNLKLFVAFLAKKVNKYEKT